MSDSDKSYVQKWSKEIRDSGEGVALFQRVVREDFAGKVTREHIPKWGKGVNLG